MSGRTRAVSAAARSAAISSRAVLERLSATRDGYRWESERAEHLRDGARADTSRMRRADLLTRAAWRHKRGEAGLAGSPVHQEIPKRAIWRWTHGPGGEPRRRGLLIVAGLVLVPLIGVGVLAGKGLYTVLDWFAPRIGRLWRWPWAAVALTLVLARWIFTDWPKLGVWPGIGRYFPGDFIHVGGWAGWASLQVIAALITVAFQIHAWGWAGVPKGAVSASAKNADGSWRVATEDERVQFDVYGADDPYEASAPEPIAEPEVPRTPRTYWGNDDEGEAR